ncbi:MAG: NADH-quinone oxidoreductase subunit M [Elusimicrobia bacterium]|nr:NADH-quinone oxidoreductase subunit M [Elusimicrobiota bacterium]
MALTFLWLVPFAGAIATALSGVASERGPRRMSLLFAALSLAAVLALPWGSGIQGISAFAERGPAWAFGIHYALSIDGLSWCLCLLNAFLTVISLLASWGEKRACGYWAAFLLLSAALMGVFLAADLFLFYIFWEAALIPMFFIIGLWGSEGRRHAAVKFFLFTFFGSLFLLVGFLALVTQHHQALGAWTWELASLKAPASGRWAKTIFLAMLVGFGVKIPLVPLHTWLPDAHTEAPAAGSMMLAGVMLKMGVYGFLRILIPLFPDLSWDWLPALGALAAVNILYGAVCAMAQSDLKRLVAYSSIAHLGFCLLGIFSKTSEGLSGGALQLINHGLTTGALFLMVGILYERSHRRGLSDFGGLALRAPWLCFFFGFSILASIGLPGLNGFVGEFMALLGMIRVLPALAIAGVFGVTLAAAYALPAYQAVFWAEAGPGSASGRVTDLDLREKGLLWTLSLLMLAIGLYPKPWLDVLLPAVQGIIR